ncbi:MAG TPA: DUF1285 domain-containing protein [Candidatus Binatia bacterium]|jgi:hypothetical protein|nr:DUF1285 domain-containing protein [Candidatus Binatia bacterium]
MPKAGFWAIDPTRKISFGKDGWWYANDERIHNRRINTLFSQHLRKTPSGTYEIAIGWDKVAVEIEDTPYVVTRVTGDAEHGLTLRLNDESEELLDPTTLSVGPENVLYCLVKGREHTARFSRPAYYQLAAYIQEDATTGAFLLRLGNATYTIPASAQQSAVSYQERQS